MTDRLDADRICGEVRGLVVGNRIRVLDTTTSTNDVVAECGRAGESGGLVVFAEVQTKGRGRFGRVWESAQRQGLWFSILLRPEWGVQNWSRLATWAAVGVAEGIERAAGCSTWVKWPNDIYIDGRKAVGILIEGFVEKNGFAVVGIGINVNQESFPAPLDETAISLRMAKGLPLDREHVAIEVLAALDRRYSDLTTRFSAVVQAAEERNFLSGRRISWLENGRTCSGIPEGLDADGGLIVRGDSGAIQVLASGEVSLSFQR